MSSLPKTLRRLVLFPLLLFYCLLLVVGAWPRLLRPTPGQVTDFEWAAVFLLDALGWQSGFELFTGRGLPPTVDEFVCFRIDGSRAGETKPLFDDLERCEQGDRTVFKNPKVTYQKRQLRRALQHARWPGAHRDLNLYPLNHLLAITDYYCRTHAVETITITGVYRTLDVKTGERKRTRVREGQRPCDVGTWRVL